jgi:hypothetical protein
MALRFLSLGQNTALVEASKGKLQILQESKTNSFNGMSMDNESWCRYFDSCSEMSPQSPAEVILRTRQAVGAKHTMIMVFFIAPKLILPPVIQPRNPTTLFVESMN